MKKAISLLLSLVLLAGLAACGQGGSSSQPAAVQSDAPQQESTDSTEPADTGALNIGTGQGGTITFWHSQTGVNGQIIEEMAAEFNETVGKDQNIVVNPIYQDGMQQKLSAVLLANDLANMPDVALGSGLDTCVYRDLDMLVWAEDLMAVDDSFSRQDILPTSAESVIVNDRLMGVPFTNSAIMLYYNKDMFIEAGLDPEKPPETIAEMAEYAEKLTVREGGTVTRYGLAVTLDRYHVSNWIGGQGEYSFVGNNESGRAGNMTKVVFGEDGTMEKFLTEFDKVVQSGGLQANTDKPREEFIAGEYAMVIQSSSRISQFLEMSEGSFELGAAQLPKVDAADTGGVAVGGGALYVIDRGDAELIGASWEFVKYMGSAEQQFKLHTATGYSPTNVHTYEMPEMIAWLEENPMYNIPMEALLESDPHVQEPLDPNPLELSSIYKELFLDFIAGERTVEETVEEMVRQCNDSLDLYYRANS